jgi:transcriptional regulator with XRE-family HTH domain
MSSPSLGGILRDAREAHDLSLSSVAARARCSAAYVHKLEADRVRTPSPRVLAGLAEALGLAYADLMGAAGYGQPGMGQPPPAELPGAVKRYSNAHIVELLEEVLREVRDLRAAMAPHQDAPLTA